jgi:hypothetical protein
MYWMLLVFGVVCALLAVAAIAIRMVWSFDNDLPEVRYTDAYLQTGE